MEISISQIFPTQSSRHDFFLHILSCLTQIQYPSYGLTVEEQESRLHGLVYIRSRVVPTSRVVVPTGGYVVPAGKVIVIVSPSRLNLVPTGRILSPGSKDLSRVGSNKWYQSLLRVSHKKNIPRSKILFRPHNHTPLYSFKMAGSDNDSDDASAHSEATIPQQQQNINLKSLPLSQTTMQNEHIAVQRESKARTTLLQSIPDDHMADDDARDIWSAVKARMQKILSQLNQLKAKPEDEDINLKFLRALPSLWSQVALTLKPKGGLELLSFDDLYYKLKTLEVDIKGYSTFSSSQSAGPSHSAFVGTTSASKKMSYADSPSYSSSTYTAPSNSKTGSHRSGNVIEEGAAKIYNLLTRADTKKASTAGDAGEFALIGVT
ncbi:hypothetical protein Tco_0340644 [Tanacetum coccineum]